MNPLRLLNMTMKEINCAFKILEKIKLMTSKILLKFIRPTFQSIFKIKALASQISLIIPTLKKLIAL